MNPFRSTGRGLSKILLTASLVALFLTISLAAQAKKPVGKATPLEGTWTLRKEDKEVRFIRFTFQRDGTWQYVGNGAKSSGRFLVAENKITLLWAEIDGQPVKLGTVKKELVLTEDGSSYTLDKFLYSRSAAPKPAR